ncbi:hypothetical protein L7F22_047113 [Adiantum nelumboides]|nr:hypothetical protein [Adiantum nelumboides]
MALIAYPSSGVNMGNRPFPASSTQALCCEDYAGFPRSHMFSQRNSSSRAVSAHLNNNSSGDHRVVTLLDYGAGNVRSIRNAIQLLGYHIHDRNDPWKKELKMAGQAEEIALLKAQVAEMSAVLAKPQVKDFLKTLAKGKEKGQEQRKEHNVNAHAVTEEEEPSKKPWEEDIPELSSPSYSPPTSFSYSSDSSSSSNSRRRSLAPQPLLVPQAFISEQYHPAIMAPLDKREVEEMIARAISQVKKEADKALNTEMRKLSDKIKQLEEERKQMEEQIKVLTDERDNWKIAHADIQQELTKELHRMQEDIHHLRGAVREEGELSHMDELKEGLKKECIAELREDMIQELDTSRGVGLRSIKKEISEGTPIFGANTLGAIIEGMYSTIHVTFCMVRNLGKPVDLASRYYQEGADEVGFLNITGFRDFPLGDMPMLEVLQRTSEKVFVPLTVGGGIRDFKDKNGVYLEEVFSQECSDIAYGTALKDRKSGLGFVAR